MREERRKGGWGRDGEREKRRLEEGGREGRHLLLEEKWEGEKENFIEREIKREREKKINENGKERKLFKLSM